MPIEEHELKTFELKYRCDDCGFILTDRGITLACNPPYFVHYCKNCNKEYNLRDKYPRIIHKDNN